MAQRHHNRLLLIDCPSADSLERLLREDCHGLEREQFEYHIETCNRCQGVLERISSQGTPAINAKLQQALSPDDGLPNSVQEFKFLRRLAQVVLEQQHNACEPPRRSSGNDEFFTPELENYEILDELGRGSGGIVYRARQKNLNRLVALKIILSGAHLSNKVRQRFRQEAQAIALLHHANIVQVYDVGEQAGCPYLSLELVEGGNLARWLGGVPRPAVESARIVEILAGAIHYAHCRGVIHRDLKPSNVLLGQTETQFDRQRLNDANSNHWVPYDLKITDFGLAKILPASGVTDDRMTQSGAMMGTPAYVAPEQARGDTIEVGPTADIYSLGAILYELLTGRPPFRGETPMETLLIAAHEQPVSLKRLVRQVPRDLQTICLKCLEKNAKCRYQSAHELAADLERFRKHEPIRARPIGLLKTSLRWMRRRPAAAVALAGAMLFLSAWIASCIINQVQRNERLQAEAANLRQVAQLQEAGNWSEAKLRLAQSKARLGVIGAIDLQNQLAQLDRNRANHELVLRLESIRLERAAVVTGPLNTQQTDQDYHTAFQAAGLIADQDAADTIAERISVSPIKAELLAAIDDWTVCVSDVERVNRLMKIARTVDPDPWRDKVRDPVSWSDRATLAHLAKSAPIAGQSVQLLVALGDRLQARGGDAIEFLNRVQQSYPADFWANYSLGSALAKKKSPEAVGYFRAALAIRPGSAVVYNCLGSSLRSLGRLDEAIEQYHRAIQIDPNYGWAYIGLGGGLRAQGRLAEAIEQYRIGLEIDQNYAWGHYVLGGALWMDGRLNEAIDEYRQTLKIDPKLTQAYTDLAGALTAVGKPSEAIDQCQIAIDVNPKWSRAYYNAGDALLNLGRTDEAISNFQQSMQLEPTFAPVYEALGLSLIAQGRFDEAQATARQALDLFPARHPYHQHFAGVLDQSLKLSAAEKRLPAILSGTETSADASDYFVLAELCFIKKQYRAATRLYAEGFSAAPHNPNKFYAYYGFSAARAAACAAGEKDQDGASVDGAERGLRIRQALTWLEAGLDAWRARLTNDSAKNRSLVSGKLSRWLTCPDLAVLRDQCSLDELSSEGQQACQKFWTELKTVLNDIQSVD